MKKAIERFNQSKQDGTLDEKFPVIVNINTGNVDKIINKLHKHSGQDPVELLNETLDYVAIVAERARQYQEMSSKDMVNYCGNYLKGKI